jgi:hypothetical protein
LEKFFINTPLIPLARNPHTLLVYPHTPRTGGVTMRKRVLAPMYGEDKVYNRHYTPNAAKWSRLTESELQGYRAYTDLYHTGNIGLMRPCVFIATLRHPVYRAVSLYHFVRRKTTHRHHALAMELPLEEFYPRASAHAPRYYRDLQCHRIAGRADAAHALEIIHRNYIGVGLTNDLADFVRALGAIFGWPELGIESRGRDAERYDSQVTPAFRDMVLRENEHDMILYETVANGLAPREHPVPQNEWIAELKRQGAWLRTRAARLILGRGEKRRDSGEGAAS